MLPPGRGGDTFADDPFFAVCDIAGSAKSARVAALQKVPDWHHLACFRHCFVPFATCDRRKSSTFDNLAKVMEGFIQRLGLKRYSLYVMDYGAPVGFRLASQNPERVEALIVQNGNAYVEGLREFWDPIRKYWKDRTPENAQALAGFIAPDGVKWQYTHGVRNEQAISPDNWNVDLQHLTREGNAEIQLALFYDYQNNVPHYPAWQAYFREHQPPTLIVWGKNDYIFPAEGAYPYKRDLKHLEFHLLDTGHFALEEDGQIIAKYIRNFLTKRVASR